MLYFVNITFLCFYVFSFFFPSLVLLILVERALFEFGNFEFGNPIRLATIVTETMILLLRCSVKRNCPRGFRSGLIRAFLSRALRRDVAAHGAQYVGLAGASANVNSGHILNSIVDKI